MGRPKGVSDKRTSCVCVCDSRPDQSTISVELDISLCDVSEIAGFKPEIAYSGRLFSLTSPLSVGIK